MVLDELVPVSMAEAAKEALEADSFKVVADAGYSNSEQVSYREAAGMMPYVPAIRTVNNQGERKSLRSCELTSGPSPSRRYTHFHPFTPICYTIQRIRNRPPDHSAFPISDVEMH